MLQSIVHRLRARWLANAPGDRLILAAVPLTALSTILPWYSWADANDEFIERLMAAQGMAVETLYTWPYFENVVLSLLLLYPVTKRLRLTMSHTASTTWTCVLVALQAAAIIRVCLPKVDAGGAFIPSWGTWIFAIAALVFLAGVRRSIGNRLGSIAQ